MTVVNDTDRYHLALDVIERVPRLRGDPTAAAAADLFRVKLAYHRRYVTTHGDDMPEIKDWRWPLAGT
jgi:xylulose-5-phosphate/fructose-6-phosphate phosphoketolase